MSADGEITVEVNAEGVDEAADDAADGVGGGEGGAGGGGESLSQSIRGGIVGGLLAAGLGPILDVLSPILDVLNAFLAPVGALLLRALQPVLSVLLTRVLPAFLSFLSEYDDELVKAIQFLLNPLAFVIGNLEQLRAGLKTGLDALKSALRSKVDIVIQRLRNLPRQIGTAISNAIPSPFGVRGSGDTGGTSVADTTAGVVGGSPGGVIPQAAQTVVDISGGLVPFIEGVTRDNRVDR